MSTDARPLETGMHAKVSGEQKPIPLRVRIMHLERRIIERQHHLLSTGDAIGHNMRRRLSSPKSLLIAAGVGVAMGYLSGRITAAVPRHARPRQPDRRRHTASGQDDTFVTRLLKVVAMTRAFLAAWPSEWLHAIAGFGRSAAPAAVPASTVPAAAAAPGNVDIQHSVPMPANPSDQIH